MEARKKRRSRKAGTAEEARGILWRALERAEQQLDAEEGSPADTLRILHAVSQGVAAYVRVVEVAELEGRLRALEQERAERTGEGGPRLAGSA